MKSSAVVKRNLIVFPLACLAALAMIFISEGGYWRSVDALDSLGEMAVARTTMQGLERSMLAAESAQRGFLLTQRVDDLLPYNASLQDLERSFRALQRHYANDPVATDMVAKLRAATQSKLSELALTIELHDQGKRAASVELVMSNIGNEHMEAVRQLSNELLAYETKNVATGRAEVYRTLLLSRIGVATLSAISLLALSLYLRQTSALKRQQQQLKLAVQAERDVLELEVAQRTAELTELARHLQTAREDERARLARDLHDELGALLTSAKLDAARIKSRLAGTAPEAQERLSHLVATLNDGIALKRRIIEDLRPSTLANLGLAETLGILAGEFAERSGVEVHCALQPVALTPEIELVVYRVVQEAINNISKYAKARHVWITLAPDGGMAMISVRDDGIGFDPAQLTSTVHGLLGMRFRVEAQRGVMELHSQPGGGCLIRIRLPVIAPTLA